MLEAGDSTAASAQSLNALTELCQIYWRPLYLFLRREGYGSEDAQDLTQGFFAELIETRLYKRADKEKGRFRSFLLGALKHFISHARDRERAQKRGGGIIPEQLDDKAIAEADVQSARTNNWNPDHLYEREWALTLLRRAIEVLERECSLTGKQVLFDALRAYLAAGSEEKVPYDQLSSRLLRPVATLRSDVARLRARYRAILREEVRSTVTEADEVEDELRHLRAIMTG